MEFLFVSLAMFWTILWPLILGFFLSAVVQAVVSQKNIARLLGSSSLRSLSIATLLGAASSSCSYAAVALARSLFRKGASFLSALVFEIASTNLVIEMGIVLAVLMGWQFTLAEFAGGLIMIILLVFFYRLLITPYLEKEAKIQANQGLAGKMEGHAHMQHMQMKGLTAISHYYVMDWVSVWTDIALGLLIAGLLAVYIPPSFWKVFFFSSSPTLAFIVGPLIGPLVAIISFVCSIGNIPLAAVLWAGGISFGGVISFLFADLIVLPILNIYRKYYGRKVTFYLSAIFYLAMAGAGYVIEVLFNLFKLIPERTTSVLMENISWNYTSWLNIIFLFLTGVLLWRFFKTKGPEMLKMMNG